MKAINKSDQSDSRFFYHYDFMPIDRSKIITSLDINPLVFATPTDFASSHNFDIRSIKPSVKQDKCQTLTLKLLNYKGIIVTLTKDPRKRLSKAEIQFNPGVCLYGHNGRIITCDDFDYAIGLLLTNLTPLLSNPEDCVDIVPGRRPGGVAYWQYLEIMHQCSDIDGSIFRSFRYVQGRNTNTSVRHWPTSIQVGAKRSKVCLGIYYKAPEMVNSGKLPANKLSEYADVLRFEVRLKDDKIAELLGNERNTEVIDGKLRLVSFYPSELFQGHYKCFSKLLGAYNPGGSLKARKSKELLVPIGRMLAAVISETDSMTFSELFDKWQFYMGASGNTSRKVRGSALAELSQRSSISLDALFSETAYRSQDYVCNVELEKLVRHEEFMLYADSLITKPYQPPNRPFRPKNYHPQFIIE